MGERDRVANANAGVRGDPDLLVVVGGGERSRRRPHRRELDDIPFERCSHRPSPTGQLCTSAPPMSNVVTLTVAGMDLRSAPSSAFRAAYYL